MNAPIKASPVRRRPAFLRALGDADPPDRVVVGTRELVRLVVFKHDSWAATALYEALDGTRIVCKFNRTRPLIGLPMAWLGRILTREARFLRRLHDVAGVPDDMGPVRVSDRRHPTAVARRYVEGTPMREDHAVGDRFFHELRVLIDAMHEHGVAYVDLHKRENILVTPDDRPVLIDFQVAYRHPSGWVGRTWLARGIFGLLKEMDAYHVLKHAARLRPDVLSPEELERAARPPRWIRAHRMIAVPLRGLRRRLLVALNVRSGEGLAGSEHEPEEAFRRDGR